jgi:hypothetical protein
MEWGQEVNIEHRTLNVEHRSEEEEEEGEPQPSPRWLCRVKKARGPQRVAEEDVFG